MTDPKHDTQPIRPITPQNLPPAPGNVAHSRSHVPPNVHDPHQKPKRTEVPPGFAPLDLPEMPPKRKRDEASAEPGGCLIPAWSLLLMLISVFACAFTILAAAIALGGDAAPGGDPQINVIPPNTTPTDPMVAFYTTPTPTLINPGVAGDSAFVLSGPTLPPIVFTPTPSSITIGATVAVDVDGGLNVRPAPGVDNTERFRANYNDVFTVVDGPANANGLTWWLLQDLYDPTRGGWAAGQFLRVIPPPTAVPSS